MQWYLIGFERRTLPFAFRAYAVGSTAVFTIVLLLLSITRADAAELKQATLQAWDAYVRTVKLDTEERASGRSPFLWVDGSPDLLHRVEAGELLVASQFPPKVPHGLIHDWIGAMFLPGVTLDHLEGILEDYEHYQDFFRPLVARSTVLERADHRQIVRFLMVQQAFGVTGAVETDDEIHVVKVDVDKTYISSVSLRVQEIGGSGGPGQQPFPEDRGPGYVWRTLGVTRLQQRDGGVYVEMETIILSRGIPFEFRWLIKPLTERLPRTIMLEMLNNTRDLVSRGGKLTSLAGPRVARGAALGTILDHR